MKSVKKSYSLAMLLAFSALAAIHSVTAQSALSAEDKKIISEFEKKAETYSNQRERLEEKLPKLPKDATADQIEAHKTVFQKLVRSVCADAKQGDIFTPEASALIRKIIKTEFAGKELDEFRKAVMDADTKGVPLKINFPYPDSIEQLEMPPALLLRLPQLPKHLRFRFVGQNLLLIDRENSLIVDYLIDALR